MISVISFWLDVCSYFLKSESAEATLKPVSYTHLRAHETREDRGLRGVG